jgi:hypothetical protein
MCVRYHHFVVILLMMSEINIFYCYCLLFTAALSAAGHVSSSAAGVSNVSDAPAVIFGLVVVDVPVVVLYCGSKGRPEEISQTLLTNKKQGNLD